LRERLHACWWAARGAMAGAIALLWPLALFATVVILSSRIIAAGVFWPLVAFVLPLTVVLLLAGPKWPRGGKDGGA
jgi:hypothetical protein